MILHRNKARATLLFQQYTYTLKLIYKHYQLIKVIFFYLSFGKRIMFEVIKMFCGQVFNWICLITHDSIRILLRKKFQGIIFFKVSIVVCSTCFRNTQQTWNKGYENDRTLIKQNKLEGSLNNNNNCKLQQ